jgi:hypothetical protein
LPFGPKELSLLGGGVDVFFFFIYGKNTFSPLKSTKYRTLDQRLY